MKKRTPKSNWTEANQKRLLAEFARLKSRLQPGSAEHAQAQTPPAAPLKPPAAIDQLTEIFGLSAFERELVILCAGIEMDSTLAEQIGAVQGISKAAPATFGLALGFLPAPHWSALTPSEPLRHFRILEVESAGRGLAISPLRIDERILHYLAGINLLDARLEPLLQASASPVWIAHEHRAAASQIARSAQENPAGVLIFHLCGDDPAGHEDAAAFASAKMGLQLFAVRAEELPPVGPELEQFSVLWQREALLLPAALLIQCSSAGVTPAVRNLLDRLPSVVFLGSRDPVRLERPFLRLDLDKPAPAEQRRLWQNALGPLAEPLNGSLDGVSEQFRLSAKTIFATGSLLSQETRTVHPKDLWNACRSLSRPRLEDLAQRIVSTASWDDLVLPEPNKQTLRQLVSQVRHRLKVYETWGFSAKGRRGLGVSALFTGESGTGKTLGAEVLASELGLDLYRVDLSAVVSKYIGETEKNLRQVFDAAEEGGVLLLFDEADALFGKRSDVKDSHDRHANVEIGYLLQRMEAYQGLAVLTTNLKSSLDRAFQRRLRFTVNFPFPDAAQREAIWAQIFPKKTPTSSLDLKKLSQLNVPGGSIRNIALNAAFLAAAAESPVAMSHLLQAARLEAQKIERPLSEAEIRGWI